MDTLGLQIFGLPDFQCQIQGLEPPKAAATLYSAAAKLFGEGDYFADGQEIAGPEPGSSWYCYRGQALAAPARNVISLEPSPRV